MVGAVRAAHDGLNFPRSVIQHHGGGLGLGNFVAGAVRVPGAVRLCRRDRAGRDNRYNCYAGYPPPPAESACPGPGTPVAPGAQPLLHFIAVGGGILQLVQLQQRFHNVPHGVFHIMGVGVQRRGFRRAFQHSGGGGIQCGEVLLLGDELIFVHAPKHVIRPVVGDFFIIGGIALAGVEIAAGVVGNRAPGASCPPAWRTPAGKAR